MSAPAMKQPGFPDLMTMLCTFGSRLALLKHSSNSDWTSFDKVFTFKQTQKQRMIAFTFFLSSYIAIHTQVKLQSEYLI